MQYGLLANDIEFTNEADSTVLSMRATQTPQTAAKSMSLTIINCNWSARINEAMRFKRNILFLKFWMLVAISKCAQK